jgi:hypothetical protein
MYRAVPGGTMLVLVLVLAGCGKDGDTGEARTPTAGGSPTGQTEPTEPPEDDVTDEPEPVAQAMADLAAEVGTDAIELVSYEQVTWRDGSLGCPQPGRMYTQALVEGYRVTLRVDGETVYYHGATGQPPIRCDHPAPGGADLSSPAS